MIRNTLLITVATFTIACSSPSLTVTVSNHTNMERLSETIEIPMQEIQTKLTEATAQNIVIECAEGNQIPSQVTADDNLIFQVTIAPNTTKQYKAKVGERQTYPQQTYARLVPERKDDWAWENNRIAFRMYGPALQATGEVSNGIDVWLKRTPELIINKWYTPGVDYHTDHGQGLDCYKVGRTLGAGAMSPIDSDTLCMGKNFVTAQLLDSGAIRTTFRLSYAPFTVGNKQISQERTISLDANTPFNRITEIYKGEFETLPTVAGITLRQGGQIAQLPQGVAYSEPSDSINGTTHLAIIMFAPTTIDTIQNHITATAQATRGKPLNYLNGAGWSKSGYPNASDWQKAVESEINKINNPLIIKIEKK